MTSSAARRGALVCAFLGALSCPAAAQPSDDTKSEAQVLFQQGRAAVEAGDCARAIPLFQQSQARYPARGTLFNLAQCEASVGRVASARRRFEELLAQLPPGDERVPISEQRIAELGPRVPKLVVELAPGAPTPTEVLLDQAPVEQIRFGVELPLDPGVHVVVARWADGTRTEVRTSLLEGARSAIRLAPAPPPAPAVTPVAPRTFPAASGSTPATASGSQRTLGFALGGVGAATLAASLVTGGIALGRKSELQKACPSTSQCGQDALALASQGETLTTTATVLGVVGLAGLGVGVTLVLTSPQRPIAVTLAPAVLSGGSGALLQGSF